MRNLNRFLFFNCSFNYTYIFNCKYVEFLFMIKYLKLNECLFNSDNFNFAINPTFEQFCEFLSA